MATFQITPATRQGVIPLIFVWGGTGGGKTETALKLACGLAGGKRIVIGDSENGRSRICSDRIPCKYGHIDFQPPFTPERYCELLDALEKNADVGVVDSLSHLWTGPDGILEEHEKILDKMVGDDWQKREAASWRAWKEPKARLNIFKDRLLRCKIPIIGCFRGEEKSQLGKNAQGKSVIVTSETTIPIFDKKLIFEALVAFEVYQTEGGGGLIRFPYPHAKVSHESIRALLPKPGVDRVTVEHGQALARWCDSAATSVPVAGPTPETDETKLKRLKGELWALMKPVRGPTNTLDVAQEWLWASGLVIAGTLVSGLTISEIEALIPAVQKRLNK